MKIQTNLNDFYKALKYNFKNVQNKDYIKSSIIWHKENNFINQEEFEKLKREYL